MLFEPSTARAIWLAKVRQARAMSAQERFLAGPRLFAGVCDRMKEGLRDDHPGISEAEIHQLLLARFAKLQKVDAARR